MIRAWDRFWFAPEPVDTRCLLRFYLGLVAVLRLTGMHGLWQPFTWTLGAPAHRYSDETFHRGPFALPWPWLEGMPPPPLWVHHTLETAMLLLAVCFMLGVAARLTGPLLAAGWLFFIGLTQLNYHHHLWVLALAIGVVGLSRCDERFSLPAWFRGAAAAPPPPRTRLPRRLLQALVVIIYAFTFLAKCNEGWLHGDVLRALHAADMIKGPFAPLVVDLLGFRLLSWFTLFAESSIPLALCVPRLRGAAIALGLALHLGIDAMMPVYTFSYTMLTLYIAFVEPAAGRVVVLIDSRRPLHNQARRAVMLFDWLRRFTWLDARDPVVPQTVAQEATDAPVMLAIEPDGTRLRGPGAVHAVARRLPATFLFAPLLRIAPLRLWTGQRLERLHVSRSEEFLERPELPPVTGRAEQAARQTLARVKE